MCEKCHEAMEKYFGDLSDDEKDAILWGLTAFPAGSAEQIVSQIEHAHEIGLGAAWAEVDAEIKAINAIERAEVEKDDCPEGRKEVEK